MYEIIPETKPCLFNPRDAPNCWVRRGKYTGSNADRVSLIKHYGRCFTLFQQGFFT